MFKCFDGFPQCVEAQGMVLGLAIVVTKVALRSYSPLTTSFAAEDFLTGFLNFNALISQNKANKCPATSAGTHRATMVAMMRLPQAGTVDGCGAAELVAGTRSKHG